MDKESILMFIRDFLDSDDANYVSAEKARKPEYEGIRFFDEPLVGYASAKDDYLSALADSADAGIDLMPPDQWIPAPDTIISFFLTFTGDIRSSNKASGKPSDLWQQARVTGQECLIKLAKALAARLREEGHDAVAPIGDDRMDIRTNFDEIGKEPFTSNWSERHIAHAAGLGTFSLSKGMITEKGMAGRFASVITSQHFEPTPRPYIDLYEYCIMCGACVRRCPGGAISKESGKSHETCARYLRTVSSPDGAFYGCGKCQCGVPCETGRPGVRANPG
jgi:epoxyqueuosine reductase QueG